MVSTILSTGGKIAIAEVLGAELLTGQLELIALEAAVVGGVLIYQHFHRKKKEREAAEQAQIEQPGQNPDIDIEPEPVDINEEDEEMKQQEDVEDVVNEQQDQLLAESERRINQLERGEEPTPDEMFLLPPDMYAELQQMREEQKNAQINNGNPDPDPDPNNPDDGDPNQPDDGNGDDPYPNNPYNRAQSSGNRNPFQDLLDLMDYIRLKNTKKQEEQQAEQPVSIEQQQENENDEISQEFARMQLAAQGVQQLTQEKILVEIRDLERVLDEQIPDQVKINSIYSGQIAIF